MPTRPPTFRPSHQPSPADQRRRFDQERGSSHARGYDRDWQRVRATVLADEPLCRFCYAAGDLVAATVVDHIETIQARPDLRLTRSNLRPLCERCHNRLTGGRTQAGRSRTPP